MSDTIIKPFNRGDHYVSFILDDKKQEYIVACICGWKGIADFPPEPPVDGWPKKPQDAWALALGQRHLDVVFGIDTGEENEDT